MAFFKNALNSVTSLFEDGKLKEAKQQMMNALTEFSADGTVTVEEMDRLNQLQAELGISPEDMADLKLKVVENLMDKVSEDGSIAPEEIQMLNVLKDGLGVNIELDLDSNADEQFVQEKLTELKGFLVKMKDSSISVAGKLADKVADKSKEVAGKLFSKGEKASDTPEEPVV